jgi:hypothetical protein
VEHDPRDQVVVVECLRHHQLGELGRFDPTLVVPLEFDPLAPQKVVRVVYVREPNVLNLI